MSIVREIKRRNVFKVAIAYVIIDSRLLDVASVVLPKCKARDGSKRCIPAW